MREIAWARTLTILPRLDGERKGSVLRFLHEANLIGDGMSIIDLHHADLKGADLSGANLNLANLSGANLEDTDTRDASFLLADLKGIYRPPDD